MSATVLRIGFLADGVWKSLVGITALALFPLLVGQMGAPAWLLGVTAITVLASAAAEIMYAIRNGGATHTLYLIAYDAAWVLVSVASVLLAVAGSGGAWELWLGYQLVAAPVIAVVFVRGARRSADTPAM